MITHGRQMQFSTIISDHPESLKQFLAVVADCGASIITVQHDRFNAQLRLDEANLHVACEVSGAEHGTKLIDALEQHGYKTIIE